MEDAKIIELFNNNFTNVLKIEEILNDYFGEDKVDVLIPHTVEEIKNTFNFDSSITEEEINEYFKYFNNSICITIYFPTVRVTNEYDKYIDITDLYVRFNITITGKMNGSFTMIRSSYSYNQYISGYCHSHTPQFSTFESAFRWKNPCLGSGPIKDTISILNTDFNKDLWSLFCLELDKYVHTESVAGVPYISMSRVSNQDSLYEISFSYHEQGNLTAIDTYSLESFIKYVIDSKELKFNYNQLFDIAMDYKKQVLLISNLFVRYIYTTFHSSGEDYLENFIDSRVLYPIYYNNKGKLCYKKSTALEVTYNHSPIFLFHFKGKAVVSTLYGKDKEENDRIVGYLLGKAISDKVINTIKNLINYKYGYDNRDANTNKKIKFL